MNDPEQPGDSRFPLTKNTASSSFVSINTPTAATSKKTARPRTWKTYAKWTAVSMLCVTGVLAGAISNIIYRTDSLNRIFGTLVKDSGDIIRTGDPTAPYDYTRMMPKDKQHVINVLIMGCDHDYDDRTQQPILTTPGRSDSIMMARIDFDHKTIKCLTIPRDTAVQIPGHKGLHKINAAHEFGDNALAVQTVKERLGIQADYYFTLDFESFQKVVDAIGGVNVVVHKKLDYDDFWGKLHIHLLPGLQRLNGYKAMGYVRIRHSDSDLMRSERQHEFIEAMRAQIMKPENFLKLPDVMNHVTQDMKSDLTQEQMLSLAKFAKGLKKEDIQLSTLPNYEGRSYCSIYPDKARKVIADLFFNGNEKSVHLDVPSFDQVARLNSGRIRLNSRGESVGDSVFEGSRRNRRRRNRTLDTTTQTDTGSALQDTTKGSEQMSADSPMPMLEETAADGKQSQRKAHSESGTQKTDKTESKSGDPGSKDSGAKDSGSKDSGSKSGDAGSKGSDTKSKDAGGDKTDPKTGGATGDTL